MPKWPFVCARLKSESLMWFNCRRCEFGPGLALPSGTWGMVYYGMVWYTAHVSRTTCPPPPRGACNFVAKTFITIGFVGPAS